MNRKIYLLIIAVIITLSLSSCLNLDQPQPEISYYTIEQTGEIASVTTLPSTLRISHFSVASAYNSIQMVYTDKNYTYSSYSYHKWLINPGNMMSDFLTERIKQSRLFKAVFPYSNCTSAEFTLNGHIDKFYELDSKDNWEAHLALTITLISEKELDLAKKILLQKTYSSSQKCLKKNPQAFAEAMSLAAAEAAAGIIKDVYQELKN